MAQIDDEMNKIVLCKYCRRPEYYGQMRWLNGRCECRRCYRSDYEHSHNTVYKWNDLDGPRPTMEDYVNQEKEI